MQRYEGLKIFKIQMVNLAINYLRGPCGPLPYEGAIRLLIVLILFWNLVDWRTQWVKVRSYWRSKGSRYHSFPQSRCDCSTKLLLVYHSFLFCIYNKKLITSLWFFSLVNIVNKGAKPLANEVTWFILIVKLIYWAESLTIFVYTTVINL